MGITERLKIFGFVSENKKYELLAKCDGEKIDRDKHELNDDAKAITKHEFSVEQKNNKWLAKVIVDI